MSSGWEGRTWLEDKAECFIEYETGKPYPVSIHCQRWETSQYGERRLIEEKAFNLVENDQLSNRLSSPEEGYR